MAHILVIDDDALVARTIARILTDGGHEVALSNGGEDGCLQCHGTQFDLVICDVFMPDKDGIETVRELRASALEVPIICVTGGSPHRDVTGAGATQMLIKPFRSSKLLETVEACLAAGAGGRAAKFSPRHTDRSRSRKDAEAHFPIKIDFRKPGVGEPWPFGEMLEWCQANVAAGAWQQHSFMGRKQRDEQGVPIDFTRWYLLNEADAEAFRQRWVS